jgi:hypothetical protein
MRRVLELTAVAAAILAVAGCAPPGATPAPAMVSVAAAPTPTLPPPGDPLVTRQVCTVATAAAADGSKTINDEIAAIELAAAEGDQTAMVSAAEEIQKTFLNLSTSLRFLSQMSVSPAVRAALLQGTVELAEITSVSYAGSTTDIQRSLTDLVAAFRRACS